MGLFFHCFCACLKRLPAATQRKLPAMRFKRVIAGVWTAALLSGATALAADSGATLAALRLPPFSEVPKLDAPQPAARRADAQKGMRVSYAPAQSIPQLRPSILDSAREESGAQVQLGAYRRKADAGEDWSRLFAEADGLLAGLTPEIVAVDLPGRGRFYRLRAGLLGDGNADALCAKLKDRGLACIPVKE